MFTKPLTYRNTLDGSEIVFELAIIHGIGQDLPISDRLYSWLSGLLIQPVTFIVISG